MKHTMSAQEIVKKDRDSLYIGNLNTVEFDLVLPENGPYGSSIKWESGHERFLTAKGKITRPTYGMGNRLVNLYATFTYEEAIAKKTYEIQILEEANKLLVSKVHPVQMEAEIRSHTYLPRAAIVDTLDGDTISHSVVWEQDGKFCFEEVGNYKLEGILTGTSYKVIAEIKIVEKKTDFYKDQKPLINWMEHAEIRLVKGSPFYECQERMRAFLHTVNDDQMLYNFRFTAGLDTKGAPVMDGWDAPDSQLRGHTTGHYLSGLALCYHATGDEIVKAKVQYMVDALAECQDAFAKMDGINPGFLSGYSEEQFDLLEQFTIYPIIWAPYYTLHKIFAGLLDCYQYVKSEKALDIAVKLGWWTWDRLSRLSYETRSKMWEMYIAGEYGGMNEVMARLYKITGTKEFLECARLFDNDKLFYPLTQNVDALSTMHGNQHIPQVLGAIELFKATGELRYYEIAARFWQYVTNSHIYATGGTGEGEMFHEANKIGMLLTENTEESCATYNMLKLSKELFAYHPSALYMDYYDRALTNHILSTLDKKTTGESTYFLPLGPGQKREFLQENSCCHGTGMESHFKYRDAIYFTEPQTLGVNLFIPSIIKCEETSLFAELGIDSQNPEKIWLRIQGNVKNVKIRKPYWAETYLVKLDGKGLETKENGLGYISLEICSQQMHLIELEMPFAFHIYRAPDVPEKAAIGYGPYILATICDSKEFIKVPFTEETISQHMIPLETKLHFECNGLTWKPLCQIDTEAYHTYVVCSK